MKVEVSSLIGDKLDWAVAKAEGWIDDCNSWLHEATVEEIKNGSYHPSIKWQQGGPIIDRELLGVYPSQSQSGVWAARPDHNNYPNQSHQYGSTPLIAAMRCYVYSKFGEFIEIPLI